MRSRQQLRRAFAAHRQPAERAREGIADAFRRGRAERSRAKSRSKACIWWRRPFAAGLRLVRCSSASRRSERAHKLLPQLSSPDRGAAPARRRLRQRRSQRDSTRHCRAGAGEVVRAGEHAQEPTGAAGDDGRLAGSGQSGHDGALGRSVWSDRTVAGRGNREPVELEGGAGFGGIVVPAADA